MMKVNDVPRAIAPNGLRLANEWEFEFDDETVLTLGAYPEAPQGDLYRFGWPSYGRIEYLLPNGQRRIPDVGNPSLDGFQGYEQYLPDNVIEFGESDIFTNTSSDIFGVPMLQGQHMLLTNGLDSNAYPICNTLPDFPVEVADPIFGKLPDGTYVAWTPTISLEPNGPSVNTPASERASSTLSDGGGATYNATQSALSLRSDAHSTFCANVPRSIFNSDTVSRFQFWQILCDHNFLLKLSSCHVQYTTSICSAFYRPTPRLAMIMIFQTTKEELSFAARLEK